MLHIHTRRNLNLWRKSKTIIPLVLSCSIDTSCHPHGAVFWRRRTHATLPVRPVRPVYCIGLYHTKSQAIRMKSAAALPPHPAQTDDAQTIPDSDPAKPD